MVLLSAESRGEIQSIQDHSCQGIFVQLRLAGISGWPSEWALAKEGNVALWHVFAPCRVVISGAGHTRVQLGHTRQDTAAPGRH